MLWRHVTQNGASHMINEITSRWVFLQGITCSQLEISTTSGSKVMAYYVIFTKAVTLTLTVILFSKNLKCQGPMNCIHQLPKESERSDQYCDLYTLLRRTNKQTDKQTDRQTNRGDQYTLQKSTILQSNERIIGDLTFYIDFDRPWPLTLTLDLDIDHSLFWKKKLEKRNVVTSRDAKRRLAYDKWNHLPMGISSRNNLQPTRNLYDFRFKSYGLLCDFHKSGDLDLNRYPIFQKFKMPGSYELHTSAAKRIRTIGPVLWPVHPSKTDKQTNRQTDRQTDKPRWPIYFAKIYDFAK